MKISINWIKEFVALPADLSAKQMAHDMTMSTVEVEDAVDLGARLDKVVVGQVKAINKHPNADRLTVVITDLGTYGEKEIVCGGTNLNEGMFVAVAMPGAQVYWHGETSLTTLKETAVRGVKSFGMICASSELAIQNLFPQGGDHEIMDLSQVAKIPGQDLSSLIGYDDIIFEIDNKSLTNRPDLWGHYGMAREFAAFYKLKLKELSFPEVSLKKASDPLKIKIEGRELCPRYTAISISGVENKESPFWLKSKLAKVGNNTHGLLVDLTNYVMLTVGEPTHVFDRTKIQGNEINVRLAKDKEKIKLLDGKELSLSPANLLISDSKTGIALAGVMGGLESAVTGSTRSIVLEAANFNAVNVRKTSAAHGIRTDSSSRFEKSLDPELCGTAGKMFVDCLKKEFPNLEVLSLHDEYPAPASQIEIKLGHTFVTSRLGDSIDQKSITEKLSLLGFSVKIQGQDYLVKVPSWRATGDVKIQEDLVEEIARVSGYDNFPLQPVQVTLSKPIFHNQYNLEKSFRVFLAETCGYQEIYTYPWVSAKVLQAFKVGDDTFCSLAIPPDQSTPAIRTTLLAGIGEAAQRNLRFFQDVSLFEFGKVFIKNSVSEMSAKGEKLPGQAKMISGVRSGKDKQKLFLKIKSDICDLFKYHNFKIDLRAESAQIFAECLGVYSQNKLIGHMGILNSPVKRALDIQASEAAAFELNFSVLSGSNRVKTTFKELPKFPVVDFDLSLLFDKKIAWADISSVVAGSDSLITDVRFIEEFYGKQIPEGKKSIVLRILLNSPEKTLVTAEINASVDNVLKNLEKKLGGELRKV